MRYSHTELSDLKIFPLFSLLGKTTTLVELIQTAVRSFQYKVLVAAPSNVAVDNLLSRLVVSTSKNKSSTESIKSKKQQRKAVASTASSSSSIGPPLKVVRLGHPARLQPEILAYSLEALVQQADGTEIVADVRHELDGFLQVLANPKSNGSSKRLAYKEIKALRKEIRTREQAVVKNLLLQAQVILATCVGAASSVIQAMEFDLVVIDEAAQALEAACWIPALKGRKLILAGDHCQLPPTIKSNNSKVQKALSRTMFERAMQLYGDAELRSNKIDVENSENAEQLKNKSKLGRISRMLQVQYRMHQTIADWASQALYGGQLQTHETVRTRTLQQLTGQNDDHSICEMPLLLIDTAGCDMHDMLQSSGSRFNPGEASLVEHHVRTLINVLHLNQSQIAVITPYNGQVEVLRAALLPEYPKLEIRSVDGFQGGEREAVVLSLVRSSMGGQDGIGFLSNDRRLNVAVTRAKRHACVICDSETVGKSKFINNLLTWIEQHGEQFSALEFISTFSNDNDGRQTHGLNLQYDLNRVALEKERFQVSFKEHAVDTSQTTSQSAASAILSKCSLEDEQRRKGLIEKISAFAEAGQPGDKLIFSSELSKGDRFAVHEEAERLGIGHFSEGVEGVDRRITLFLPQAVSLSNREDMIDASASAPEDHPNEEKATEEAYGAVSVAEQMFTGLSPFSVLDAGEEEDDNQAAQESLAVQESLASNLVVELSRERIERERLRSKAPQIKNSSCNTKTKKNKAQRLGGTKKSSETGPKIDDVDDLDDIAFLDSQIKKVQTAHGRKVDGSSGYRTIINGILTAKPIPHEDKKDERASKVLQSKLKQAQNSRKAKVKKK